MAEKQPAKKTDKKAKTEKLTPELLYKKAKELTDQDEWVVSHRFRKENFLQAAELFEQAGDYEDAPFLARQCRERATQSAQLEQKTKYENAVRCMQQTGDMSHLERARQGFAQLGDYADSRDLEQKCRDEQKKLRRKGARGFWVFIIAAAALTVAAVAFVVSGMFDYCLGIAYYRKGDYDKAQVLFEKREDFLDSADYAERSKYMCVKKAKKDEVISFGDYSWRVLDRKQGILTLICTGVREGHDFYHVAFDDGEAGADWEHSSLREYLNSEILAERFNDFERSLLLEQECPETVNQEYHTSQGAVTDMLTILSDEETVKYKKVLSALRYDYWLRTPGSAQDMEAYYAGGTRQTMYYGYPVKEAYLSVLPVIQVDTSQIAREKK